MAVAGLVLRENGAAYMLGAAFLLGVGLGVGTVSRYHYESHEQIRKHMDDFILAYNFARRLKTLKGLTPYEFLCKSYLAEPERFRIDSIHRMPGPYT